jgi:hypothetical protein
MLMHVLTTRVCFRELQMVFIRSDATYFTSQVPTQNVFATLSSLAGAVASLIGVLAFVMVLLEDRFYVPDPEAEQAELEVCRGRVRMHLSALCACVPTLCLVV